ncbi:hypothetical protein CA951_01390 [Rhodococcus sp. NCIMB 12038]|nr:hypothetical protein CA951_01390 [Rhodococcus sp. NCIMB 12038]
MAQLSRRWEERQLCRLCTVRAEDDSHLLVHGLGLRCADPSTSARLRAGEVVDPAEYYFRLGFRFEADSDSLRGIEHRLGIGSAVRHPHGVACDVYLVG